MVGHAYLKRKGLSYEDYKQVITLTDVPLDELGLLYIAKLWGRHFAVIMKDFFWTTGIGLTVEDCAIVFAYTGGLVFLDTIDIAVPRQEKAIQYATPYYDMDPQENAVNLSANATSPMLEPTSASNSNSVAEDHADTVTQSSGDNVPEQSEDMSEFLNGLLVKNGITKHVNEHESVGTLVSTEDGELSNPLQTPLGMNTNSGNDSQLGMNTNSGNDSQLGMNTDSANDSQLGMMPDSEDTQRGINQVEDGTLTDKNRVEQDTSISTSNQVDTSTELNEVDNNNNLQSTSKKPKKSKKRKHDKKDKSSSEPPKKKPKKKPQVSSRSLHSNHTCTTPRKSKNSSKPVFSLTLEDVLGKRSKCKAAPTDLKEKDPVQEHLSDERLSDVSNHSDHSTEYEEQSGENIETCDGTLNVVHHGLKNRKKWKSTKTFPCPVCKANHKDVVFSSNSGLNKHMKEEHPRFRFQCSKCDKMYGSYNACYKHIVRSHYLL